MILFSICIIFLSPITLFSVTSLTLPKIEKFKQSFLQTVDPKLKRTLHILQLHCTAAGSPNPEIEFHYNGKRLSNNSSRIQYDGMNAVKIYNVSYLTDEGIYKCMAKNIYGNVFEEEYIRMPTIGQFLPGKGESGTVEWHEVQLGGEYELVCPEHTHAYPINYYWVFKDSGYGLKFIDKNEPTVHITQNGRLFISSVTKEIVEEIRVRGGVRCMIQMGDPELPEVIYSRPFGLHYSDNKMVANIASKIVHDFPNNIYVKEGNSVKLQCLARGSPLPTIKWFWNGEEISGKNLDYVTNDKGTLLTIKNVDKQKLGQFMCEARNVNGQDKRTGNLILGEPARLSVKLPPAKTVPEGNRLQLECSATGTPPLQYYWYRNGSLLSDYCYDNVCLKIHNGVLEISYINKSDKGQYQCTAKNSYGSDNGIVHIIVTKPEVKQPTTGVSGQNVSDNETDGNNEGTKTNSTGKYETKEGSLTTQHIVIIACGGTVFFILFAGGIFLYCRTRNDNKEVRLRPTPPREVQKMDLPKPGSPTQRDFPPPPRSFTDFEDDDDLSSFGSAKLNHPEFICLMSDLRNKQNGGNPTRGSTTPEHLYFDIPDEVHSLKIAPSTNL